MKFIIKMKFIQVIRSDDGKFYINKLWFKIRPSPGVGACLKKSVSGKKSVRHGYVNSQKKMRNRVTSPNPYTLVF